MWLRTEKSFADAYAEIAFPCIKNRSRSRGAGHASIPRRPLTAFLLAFGEHVKTRLSTSNRPDEFERQILRETIGDNDRHT